VPAEMQQGDMGRYGIRSGDWTIFAIKIGMLRSRSRSLIVCEVFEGSVPYLGFNE